MSKRLKELADEAGIYKLNLSNETEYWIIEKFAELIVRHCALTAGLMEHQGRTGIGAQLLDNFEIKD
jgi:hypothetical protein